MSCISFAFMFGDTQDGVLTDKCSADMLLVDIS